MSEIDLYLDENENLVMRHNQRLSNCCNAPVLWTSYNRESYVNQPADDHYTCSKCKKECEVEEDT